MKAMICGVIVGWGIVALAVTIWFIFGPEILIITVSALAVTGVFGILGLVFSNMLVGPDGEGSGR